MKEISATEAARAFSEVLDEVEHASGEFTVVRHGRPVARITPVRRGGGDVVKDLLRVVHPDPEWGSDLAATRSLLHIDER